MLSSVQNFWRQSAIIMAMIVLTLPTIAHAQIDVDVNNPNVEPVPIAVPDFISQGPEAQKVAIDIAGVIANDLDRSGLFAPIDKRAFLSRPAGLAVRPNFVNQRCGRPLARRPLGKRPMNTTLAP